MEPKRPSLSALIDMFALNKLSDAIRGFNDKALKNLGRTARRKVTDNTASVLGLLGPVWKRLLGKLLNRVIDSTLAARRADRRDKKRKPHTNQNPPVLPTGQKPDPKATIQTEIVVRIRDRDGGEEMGTRFIIESDHELTREEIEAEALRLVGERQGSPKGRGAIVEMIDPIITEIFRLNIWNLG